jgi:predicted Zn-dependent protease
MYHSHRATGGQPQRALQRLQMARKNMQGTSNWFSVFDCDSDEDEDAVAAMQARAEEAPRKSRVNQDEEDDNKVHSHVKAVMQTRERPPQQTGQMNLYDAGRALRNRTNSRKLLANGITRPIFANGSGLKAPKPRRCFH